MRINEDDALIVTDVQNDFCPGGALPVPQGDAVVSPINRLVGKFETLVYSRDYHPEEHCSFSLDPRYCDGSWPYHCVQDTPGAEFHGDLRVPLDAVFIEKGTNPDKEAYSAFEDTDLEQILRKKNIARLFITGLALDYCVKATALDALRLGFAVVVVEDATRGISEDSSAAAKAELLAAGVTLCRVGDISS